MINELIKNKKWIMGFLKAKHIQQVDADEIYSDISLFILENKLEISDFKTWLLTTLQQQIKLYKKKINKEKYEGNISYEQLQEQGVEIDQEINRKIQVENTEIQQIRQKIIDNLTAEQFKYFQKFEEGLSNKNIAKELNVSIQAVGYMKRYLRKILKIKE